MVAAADIDVPFEGLADRTAFLEKRTGPLINVQNYGADPTGAVACDDAVTAAQDEANDKGGGLIWPAGSYKHADSLHPDAGVPWYGVPGATFINIDHATKDQLIFDHGSSAHGWTLIHGLGFGAKVDNNGKAVSLTNDVRVLFNLCTWNEDQSGSSPKLKGKLLNAADGNVMYARCYHKALVAGVVMAFTSVGGRLYLVDETELELASVFTGTAIQVDDGRLIAPSFTFDASAVAGAGALFELLATGPHRLAGECISQASAGMYAIKTVSGGEVIHERCRFTNFEQRRYNLADDLGAGSSLRLPTKATPNALATGTIVAFDYVRSESIHAVGAFGGNGPTLQLPKIYTDEQRYTVLMFNDSGVNWALGVGLSGSVLGEGTGAINAGHARALDFAVLDVDGTLKWVQTHDASTAWTVP